MDEKADVSGKLMIKLPDLHVMDIGESKITKRKWVKFSFQGEEWTLNIGDFVTLTTHCNILPKGND